MSRSDTTATEDQNQFDYVRLFQNLPQAYLLFEAKPDYQIVDLNKMHEQLMGVARKAAIGRPLFSVYPDSEQRVGQGNSGQFGKYIQRMVRTGQPMVLEPRGYDMTDEQGVRRVGFWRWTSLPLRDVQGKIAWILVAGRDVTEEIRAERHATNTENRLEAALLIGKVGSWVWNIKTNSIVPDKNLIHLLGITKQRRDQGLTLQTFLSSIHADDRSRIERAIKRSVRHLEPFEEEYRMVSETGRVRWVLARGKLEEVDGIPMFPGVVVDVTERRDLQAQIELARKQDQLNRQAAKILQERNEELEELARSKDEFVALASHQLRTPATAVKQYLGMVLQGYAGEVTDTQVEMLQKAFESNERQIQIVNQILNAARVDTGRLSMTRAPLDICTLLSGITEDMRPQIEHNQHTFTVQIPKQPLVVLADLGYLRMAIENVIHNACVYTPAGGLITVRMRRMGSNAIISVADTGVGIKKSDMHKLFVKFSRIHNPLSVQAGGSGIGLYLTAEIVRQHGGLITVESRVNKGSTFAISLPLVA